MAAMTSELIATMTRNERVVTVVRVARDWAINTSADSGMGLVEHYMRGWLTRNGAVSNGLSGIVADLVDAVWDIAALDDGVDPLTLVDDDWRGTASDARDWLRNRYETDVQHALNRITWKD